MLEKYWWFQISFGKKCKLRLCSFEIMLCNLIHTFQYENSQGKLLCHCYRLQKADEYFIDCYVWWKYHSGETDLAAYLIWRKFSWFPSSWEFFLSAITSYYCHLSTKCCHGFHIQMRFPFYSYFWASDSYQSCDR